MPTDDAAGRARRPDSQQLSRQWAILRILSSDRRAFTVKELSDQLATSKATIQRDLATIVQHFAVIEEQAGKQKRVYRIAEQIRALESISFGISELLALFAASSSLIGLAGTPLHEDLESVRTKIRGFLGDRHNGGLQAIAKVFVPHRRGAVDYGPQHELIDQLSDAIAQRYECTLVYEAKWKGTTRTHRARPLRLVWHQAALYLLACLGEHERISTLAVHRIQAFTGSRTRFKPPAVDVEGYTERAFGIFVNDAEEDVEIVFSADIAWRVQERTFHPAEVKEPLPDGSLRYTVRSSAMWEIVPWVMTFGPHAELRRPAAWRAELVSSLEAMRARYAAPAP